MIFSGKVKNGELFVFARTAYLALLSRLEGQEVDVELRKHRDRRTTDQNKYYWWIMNFVSAETGHTPDDLHEFYKHKFLAPKIEILGETSFGYVTSTKLDTKEFTDYIEQIRQFMQDFGIYIPQANEIEFLRMEEK